MLDVDPTFGGHNRARTVDDIVVALQSEDPAPIGALRALDHGLQCAALLRCAYPEDLELQVAGLLHDIGHLLVPHDSARHARRGAVFVGDLLGERVATLIDLHEPAKRWLAAVDPSYPARPSGNGVAVAPLGVRPMAADERRWFGALSDRRAAIALRRADDGGRTPGLRVPDVDWWMPTVERLAARPPRRTTSDRGRRAS